MSLLFMFLLVLAFLFAILSVGTLSDLTEARVKAGERVITLRDQSAAEGFQESEEFDKNWDAAIDEYTKAQAAEDAEISRDLRKRQRAEFGERIRADSERLSAALRDRTRPDYNPREDPRSQSRITFPTPGEWKSGLATWAMFKSPSFDPSEQDLAAVKRCRINLHSDEVLLPTGRAVAAMVAEFQEAFIEAPAARRGLAVRNALASWNTMTPDSAGYVAQPPTVLQQIEVNRLAWGGLLQVATTKQTTTGEDILLPFTDDTTVKGRRIAEDGPLGVEVNPKFGQMKWGAHKYTSDVIAVTYEMFRDAFFDLETHIGEVGGERLGRIENLECTVGVGASMPRGIVFAAPIGVTCASSVAITYDEVIDLEMSVDNAYQSGERVGFMMHKNILKLLRKLKDLEGRPLLQLGQETGNRDRLNGRPIYINMDMASAAVASADVMLYGDFAKYWIRRVGGQRVVRDPYTQRISNDRDLFAVVEYLDGNLVNAGTAPVKKMRMLP